MICGEMKITDLAMIFFTCGLFIVGWFTLRSNENTVENLERPYLWPGYGLMIEDQDSVRIGVHLGIRNTGRTVGIVKTVHHALINQEDYDTQAIITYSTYQGREDAIIPDPNAEARSGVWHRLDEMPKVSCGWITYLDIFGETHRQGYKYLIHSDGRTNSLPNCFTYEPWKVEHKEKPSDQEALPRNVSTKQISVSESA